MSLDDAMNEIGRILKKEGEPEQPAVDVTAYVDAIIEAKKLADYAMPVGGEMERSLLMSLLVGDLLRNWAKKKAISARCPYFAKPEIAGGRPMGSCLAMGSGCPFLSRALSIEREGAYTECLAYAVKREMEKEDTQAK